MPLPRITDLYKALGISSRAGDRILDRLEQCWGYIICDRGRRIRYKCYPTYMGLIAIYSKPEYRSELIKHLLARCRDVNIEHPDPTKYIKMSITTYTGEQVMCTIKVHGWHVFHEVIHSPASIFFKKNLDDLATLINDCRNTLLNHERLRKAITNLLTELLNDEEARNALTDYLGLPRTTPTDIIINNFLNYIMSNVVIRAMLDLEIKSLIDWFLSDIIRMIFEKHPNLTILKELF